ncbi:FecR family protein [Niabella beijingensis]|uniref:FecR family protein n=1 Tax=Niabella beijingensis TaxID=2872700 RepID=UPI001CBFF398|nr:FecR family protein [Niabella beijingensis]MBZ4192259.1 DUF4974 domain-containing protein [Niabella beijingensis]
MKPDKDVIERFLKNQCTDAEAEIVDRFFKENPGELEWYLPVSAWLTGPEMRLNEAVSTRILQQIRKKYEKRKRTAATAKLLRYIAAACIAGLVVWMGLKFFTDTQTPEHDTMAAADRDAPGVLKTIENKTGNLMQLILPDGSVVTLYPGGQLQYLPAFETNRRTLYLEGKAGFEVSKDKTRPFTVYASGIGTTALGTKFLVSVLENQRVSVILKEGVVKVSPQHGRNAHMNAVLHPGDQLIVDSGQFSNYSLTHQETSTPAVRKRETHTVSPAPQDTLAKKEARLVFKNQPLGEVFRKIEKKFDVIIDYKNAPGIEEKLFTGIFLENDSLEFICNLICKLHELHYSIEGRTVIIRTK